MSVLRVPVYRPTLEGLAHSPRANMAVEAAFILLFVRMREVGLIYPLSIILILYIFFFSIYNKF